MVEPINSQEQLRKAVDDRLKGLYTARYSFWSHWRELADYILPRRYRWLITPNEARGGMLNRLILDATGTIAARNLASGMMAGITSPTRPWFKLRIDGYGEDETHPVNVWLAQVERILQKVFAESNFYNCMALLYLDLAVFGTAVILMYEDKEDVIRCYNPALGEYYLENSSRMQVNVFYRDFVLTQGQTAEQFKDEKENWSDSLKANVERGGAGLSQEVRIAHAIEPNTDGKAKGLVPKSFPYREVYWEVGSPNNKLLSAKGFYDFPAICVRWDITSNDAYGRSTGMDALGDIKQLQQETKRKGQAIDKMVNPPMVADIQLKNQPASMIPGGVTYVAGFAATGKPGFSPAYLIQPQIEHMMLDIQQVQERIKNIFFNDLFLMISQLETVRTATEIDARREEKLIMLGPVLDRIQDEGLSPIINRTFNIAQRKGILPPPPPEAQGLEIDIEYVSMLAQAQKAVATTSIERVLGLAGSLAGVRPDVLDNINYDEGIHEYAGLLGTPPKLLLDPRTRDAIRQKRAEEKQMQQGMAVSSAMVQGAKTLSDTQVGAGQNALQAMTGL